MITMEPGLYFIDALVKSEKKREDLGQLVNWEKAESLLDFGGIRIEDDLLITAEGCRELSAVPKSIEDLESIRSRV